MPEVHCKPVQVDEGLIDIHRHVNNQEYLRWMQEIAIEHSTLQGWPMARYLQTGASWYVRSHFIEYLQPCQAGEEIVIHTWVANFKKIRSLRKYRFVRVSDGAVLANAQTDWVFLDFRKGRPMAIPPEVLAAYVVVPEEEERNIQ